MPHAQSWCCYTLRTSCWVVLRSGWSASADIFLTLELKFSRGVCSWWCEDPAFLQLQRPPIPCCARHLQHDDNLAKWACSSCCRRFGRVPTDAANAEFDVLKRTVSHAALRMLKKQFLLAVANDYDNAEECTGSFTLKYSLPCKHYLHRKIYELRTMKDDPNAVYNIPLAVIDQHWWLDPPRARGGTLRMMVTSSGL